MKAILLNVYDAGLYVERYIECPRCTSLSFTGEWQTPKDLQAVAYKTCDDCGQQVSTTLLIQPLEKKKSRL
jgi:DNA-directed RNA polymerase subunit RPC12/RpoP